MDKKLKITLVRSRNGRLPKHKACLDGLGLKKINQTVVLDKTPEVLGMLFKVGYLLKIEEYKCA